MTGEEKERGRKGRGVESNRGGARSRVSNKCHTTIWTHYHAGEKNVGYKNIVLKFKSIICEEVAEMRMHVLDNRTILVIYSES